ncbi:alcohol dehydrogenase class-3-like, partial [Hermetia illucens]|uniref:alcohol dehydrogenase class-3-like n=1 Tax=Hermetia illucens TaxID=343691 RepID=UPI0018CC787B
LSLQVIKCRAAVVWEVNQRFSIEEIEVDPPKAHEVRVKMVSTGLCHSDLSVKNGVMEFSNKFPQVPGHEGAGIVESVGEKVTKFKPGDHVIPLYAGQCLKCDFCKSGKTNTCEVSIKMQEGTAMIDGTSRLRCKGKMLYQFMSCGTFSEYTVVEDIALAKISNKAPLEKVCLIGCGIPTGYGAAVNAAKVKPGSKCAVWGLGGIGLAAVMGCKKAGASEVWGIDINPAKFDLARKFGCTHFANPNDYKGRKFADVLLELTKGGFDYTFECAGQIATMRQAVDSSHRAWGRTTLVGIATFSQDLNVFPFDLICGRSIGGTFFGSYQAVESVPKLVDEYLNNELMVDDFITHTFKLEQINEGFDLMIKGGCLRSIVIF